jgi:broad specificity phosphatase PhoE
MTDAPTTLILIRHGETLGNRHRRYQTYDTPLSDVGRAQAERLAQRLAAEPPLRALYSSDLERTRETAAIVARRLGLTPELTPALRELDVGDWKGQTYEEIETHSPGGLQTWRERSGTAALPGPQGESAEDVARRAGGFVERVIERHAGERVALVSHGLTLRVLLAYLEGRDCVEGLRDTSLTVGNTSVSIVEVTADARRCLLRACVAHLDGLADVAATATGTV